MRVEGAVGQPVRAVVELWPLGFDALADALDLAPETALRPHPRRAGAVVLEGSAPLVFRLRRVSGASPAFAFFVANERVLARHVRFHERCFNGPGSIELCISAAAWSDAEISGDPPRVEPGVWIELVDPPPALPPPALTKSQQRALRLLARPD